jgi:hypothetical protein
MARVTDRVARNARDRAADERHETGRFGSDSLEALATANFERLTPPLSRPTLKFP